MLGFVQEGSTVNRVELKTKSLTDGTKRVTGKRQRKQNKTNKKLKYIGLGSPSEEGHGVVKSTSTRDERSGECHRCALPAGTTPSRGEKTNKQNKKPRKTNDAGTAGLWQS